jgi:hypothetical protein
MGVSTVAALTAYLGTAGNNSPATPHEVVFTDLSLNLGTIAGVDDATLEQKYVSIDFSRLASTSNDTIVTAAFIGCTKLTAITLPQSIATIGAGAFNGCTGLTTLNCYAANPPSFASTSFSNVPNTLIIKVPASAVADYQVDINWAGLVADPSTQIVAITP